MPRSAALLSSSRMSWSRQPPGCRPSDKSLRTRRGRRQATSSRDSGQAPRSPRRSTNSTSRGCAQGISVTQAWDRNRVSFRRSSRMERLCRNGAASTSARSQRAELHAKRQVLRLNFSFCPILAMFPVSILCSLIHQESRLYASLLRDQSRKTVICGSPGTDWDTSGNLLFDATTSKWEKCFGQPPRKGCSRTQAAGRVASFAAEFLLQSEQAVGTYG